MSRGPHISSINKERDWVDRAKCKGMDPELFFPNDSDRAQEDAAKRVCQGCPVSEPCLEYALAVWDIEGIWAGTTFKDRRRIRRQRRIARRGEAASA